MTYEDFKAAWKTAYAEAEKNDPENPIPYAVHQVVIKMMQGLQTPATPPAEGEQ